MAVRVVSAMLGAHPSERAYLGPFAVFLGLLAFGDLVAGIFEGRADWVFAEPRYWIYPLQTVMCGGLLWFWWGRYPLARPRKAGLALLIGLAVFVIWIAPQTWLQQAPRWEGFNPWFFSSRTVNRVELAFRFLRLVIVVPLLEEIFWRGFLLRWLIRDDFEQVPFGTWNGRAFAITTVGFCLEHQLADWPAAALAGALYNLVAIRTRSLSSCVLAHAVTNLLLGIYVLRTGQWGFW